LVKRGFSGPGICVLCSDNEENIDHIFVFCRYTKYIWSRLVHVYSYAQDWGDLPLTNNFEVWAQKQPRRTHLPILVSWILWKARNSAIFEQTRHSATTILNWIIQLYSYYPKKEFKKKRIPHNIPSYEITHQNIGTFDGVEQRGNCGGGGTITLHDGRVLHYKVGLGTGTNNRVELLSLWTLLWLAKRLLCEDIQVFGDSMAIIDWINERSHIRNTMLTHWYQRTIQLRDTFTNIYIQHLYREQNHIADVLSKEGLLLDEGTLLIKDVSLPDTQVWETHIIY